MSQTRNCFVFRRVILSAPNVVGRPEGPGHREHAPRRLHLPRLHLEAVHLARHQSHAPSPRGRRGQMLPLHSSQVCISVSRF